MDTTRRNLLALAGLAPFALIAARSAVAAEAACYDPASLPLSQKSRRRSLGFVDVSPDPNKRCGACAFFVAGQSQSGQGQCGACNLLGGGPVGAGSVCASFAARGK